MVINSESKILAMVKGENFVHFIYSLQGKKFEDKKIEDAIDQEKNE